MAENGLASRTNVRRNAESKALRSRLRPPPAAVCRVSLQRAAHQITVLSKTIVDRLTLRVVPSAKFTKLFLRWLLVWIIKILGFKIFPENHYPQKFMLSTATSRQKRIEVLFFSPEVLTQECVLKFLRDEQRISIAGQAITKEQLLKYNAQFKPDINLFTFTEQNFQVINIIPELHKSFPQAKVVVLTDSDDTLMQAYALEQGAVGIIQKECGIKTLVRTIEQVKAGEIMVNQKLLRQLIKKDAHNGSKSKSKKPSEIDSITKREQGVIEMIATGMKNKEIAEILAISEATVRHHLSSIYSKLMVDDRLNLVIYAYQHKLVELSD